MKSNCLGSMIAHERNATFIIKKVQTFQALCEKNTKGYPKSRKNQAKVAWASMGQHRTIPPNLREKRLFFHHCLCKCMKKNKRIKIVGDLNIHPRPTNEEKFKKKKIIVVFLPKTHHGKRKSIVMKFPHTLIAKSQEGHNYEIFTSINRLGQLGKVGE